MSAYRVLYGDIHNHNAHGYGVGSIERSLEVARAHLDFFAFTGHSSWHDMPSMEGGRERHWIEGFRRLKDTWPRVQEVIAGGNRDGEFCAFLGFEWHSSRWGDQCVVFPRDHRPLCRVDDPHDLRRFCLGEGALMIPHHLAYPAGRIDQIPNLMRPHAEGGVLHHKGQVEVVSSLHPDGTPVDYDIRFGVFVAFEGESEYIRRCFAEYGVKTDDSGRYACLYKRWHLIGLEVGISVASVGLRREPTGCATGFRADAVATAKRALKPGELLDGEGGYTVVGRLMPAADSLAQGCLPLGLAHGWKVLKPVAVGQPVRVVFCGSLYLAGHVLKLHGS